MYQPPPLRGRSVFDGKKVLLIDPNQTTRDVLASVLRTRGIEVHAADSLQTARSLWRPNVYSWIFLKLRRQLPGEALAFYEQIRDKNLGEHFVFLVGPPQYLSLTWPEDIGPTESEPQQWAETVKRFVAAA